MDWVFFGPEFVGVVSGLLANTEGDLLIVQYEWKWYHRSQTSKVMVLTRQVMERARAGRGVRVVLHNESPGRYLGKVNRTTGQRLQAGGVQVKLNPAGQCLHAKVWIFGEEAVVVGSHNMTQRALTFNGEVGAVLRDRAEVLRARDWFERQWRGAY